jgi:hypothetical protein
MLRTKAMHVFKVSEPIFRGAELQVSLRLSSRGLATFLGSEAHAIELAGEFPEDLEPGRRYMAEIAVGLPALIDAGSEYLLQRQIELLQEQNARKEKELEEKDRQ